MTDPLAFVLPGFGSLLNATDVERGGWMMRRFPDGELYVRLRTAADGRDCFVVGTLAPPDRNLLAVLLLAHTLVRAGAVRVSALVPYLGYARQDRAEPLQSVGLEWAGALLLAAGVEEVVTVDVHSAAAAARLPLPVRSLSPASLLAQALPAHARDGASVVAPDEGAVERARAVAAAAGIDTPVAVLRKQRTPEGVVHASIEGPVAPHAVIVDDILDTGGTLISACRQLRATGAREITVLVTHGLFTGSGWRQLGALGVTRIVTTDSLPTARRRGGAAEVLPIAPLLEPVFQHAAAAV